MKLPFQIKPLPDFRQAVLDSSSKIILQQNGKWLDVLACRGKDIVYISTIPTC